METVISYVEIHVAILCTLATIEYLRVTYFVNEKFNNCEIVRSVLLTDIINHCYNFPAFHGVKCSISAFEIFRKPYGNGEARHLWYQREKSCRSSAVEEKRHGGGEAARLQLPPLRAHYRLLPLTSRAHWPNRAIFMNRLRKIYRSDRVSVQDFLS